MKIFASQLKSSLKVVLQFYAKQGLLLMQCSTDTRCHLVPIGESSGIESLRFSQIL